MTRLSQSIHNWRLFSVIGALIIGAFAIGAFLGPDLTPPLNADDGDDHHGSEVRARVRVLADGRTEVAIQERSGDSWRNHLPVQRFLSDPDPNRWYASSSVSLAPAAADTATQARLGVGSFGPFTYTIPLNAANSYDRDTLFCLVSHGRTDDWFWERAYDAAFTAAGQLGLNVRPSLNEHAEDQAAAIAKCVDDGAAVIATSIPNPDVILPAIAAGVKAGVKFITFNSGSAPRGAYTHISLDEANAGRTAAKYFLEGDVSGDIICILHEAVNVGLSERCDGLDDAYDRGEVIRLNIHDASDRVAAIGEAIRANPDVSALLGLNANTGRQALEAALTSERAIKVGQIGSDLIGVSAVREGDLLFVVSDMPTLQTYLTVATMLLNHGQIYNFEAVGFDSSVKISPFVMTRGPLLEQIEELAEAGSEQAPVLFALNAGLAQYRALRAEWLSR